MMPNPIILVAIAVILLALLFVAFAVLKARQKVPNASAPDSYDSRASLLTPAERSFLGVIEPLLPSEVRVCPKVRLEDFLSVKKGLGRAGNQAARNRINRKHVDFLIVQTTDFKPIAAIELDDKSHDADDRKARDAFVDTAFASAGLPLLHVAAAATYNPADIRAKIGTLLNAA
jgi:hypothetical protein